MIDFDVLYYLYIKLFKIILILKYFIHKSYLFNLDIYIYVLGSWFYKAGGLVGFFRVDVAERNRGLSWVLK